MKSANLHVIGVPEGEEREKSHKGKNLSAKLLWSWNSPGKNTEVGSHSLLQGIFWTRGQTWVFCISGRFFNIWATREAPWYSTQQYHHL